MAMKSPQNENPHVLVRMLRQLIKAPAALSVLWPALLILLGYAAWHRWGADHVAERFYGVDASLIEITPPPDYVRSDVVASVYRDTAMEGLSLLDSQATAKIAAAFSMHPWVRRVVSVRKLPGGKIDVRVMYREPVAMVLVEKPDETGGDGSYFFPVDGEGVLLPTGEFARAEIKQFIHIVVPGVYATGRVGSPFGDQRVESAARLAAVLAPFHEQAQIVSIDVPGDPRLNQTPQLELTTKERSPEGEWVMRKRFWGSPPGSELPGEPTAEMKLRTLLSSDATQIADLRIYHPAGPQASDQQSDQRMQAQPASSRSQPRKSAGDQSNLPGWQPQGRRVPPLR